MPIIDSSGGLGGIILPGGGGVAIDSDAQTIIDSIETADAQALDSTTINAINNLVLNWKASSVWATVAAGYLQICGARTLAGYLLNHGALGNASATNFNFVAGDYARATGAKGDGSSKYLRTGLNNNAFAQNNMALWCYITTAQTISASYMGTRNVAGHSALLWGGGGLDTLFLRLQSSPTAPAITPISSQTGFGGISRTVSSSIDWIYGANSGSESDTSTTPLTQEIGLFCRLNVTSPEIISDARIGAFGISAAATLADIKSGLDTYFSAISGI